MFVIILSIVSHFCERVSHVLWKQEETLVCDLLNQRGVFLIIIYLKNCKAAMAEMYIILSVYFGLLCLFSLNVLHLPFVMILCIQTIFHLSFSFNFSSQIYFSTELMLFLYNIWYLRTNLFSTDPNNAYINWLHNAIYTCEYSLLNFS